MKKPQFARLLLGVNEKFQIQNLHFDTNQVTLKENDKVFNTVSLKYVLFDYSGFTKEQVIEFENCLRLSSLQ